MDDEPEGDDNDGAEEDEDFYPPIVSLESTPLKDSAEIINNEVKPR